MLQEILTDLVVAIALSFCAIVVFDFVAGLVDLVEPKTAPSQDEQLLREPVEPAIAPVSVPDPWLETVVVPKSQSQTSWSWSRRHAARQPVLCLPPSREDKPDYAKLTSEQLRKECSQRNVAWRNAHCGKHLTKAQMIARLTA